MTQLINQTIRKFIINELVILNRYYITTVDERDQLYRVDRGPPLRVKLDGLYPENPLCALKVNKGSSPMVEANEKGVSVDVLRSICLLYSKPKNSSWHKVVQVIFVKLSQIDCGFVQYSWRYYAIWRLEEWSSFVYNMIASSAWDSTYYAQCGDVVVDPYNVHSKGVAVNLVYVQWRNCFESSF